jgi:hypothetical protein
LLRKYLEGVRDDGFGGQLDKRVGALHSDRHQALLAHFRVSDGEETDADRRILREAAVVDAERSMRLRHIADQLARHGIDALVLKGAAFAHVAYPAPYLRPRNDDDLWVRERDFAAACALLEACGYAARVEVTSAEITKQRHFVASETRAPHQVDLHWWPVNPSAFDALPAFNECFRESVTLDAIGADVRAPGRVHALLLACAHRVAHHTETEDAMWHCDIHFLATRLAAADWRAFESEARRAEVARVAGASLRYVMTRLGTAVPPDIVERLLLVAGEPSSRYLRPLGPLGDLWLELRARDGVQERLRLLTHHVLPPREYVAARYGYTGVALLPFFYAHRAINGFAHWTAELMARLAR